MNYSDFFVTDKKNKLIRFVGDKLEATISRRYEKFGALSITPDAVMAIAILELVVNDTIELGILLPAVTKMHPTEMSTFTANGDEFLKMTFLKNDVFMTTELVQNGAFAYIVFNEIVILGRMPKFMTYDNAPLLFDIIEEVTGTNFWVDHAIYELMFAFMFRAKDDFSVQYRHTQMKGDYQFVQLGRMSELATTTSSRLLGAYLDNNLDTMLTHPSEHTTPHEQLIIR